MKLRSVARRSCSSARYSYRSSTTRANSQTQKKKEKKGKKHKSRPDRPGKGAAPPDPLLRWLRVAPPRRTAPGRTPLSQNPPYEPPPHDTAEYAESFPFPRSTRIFPFTFFLCLAYWLVCIRPVRLVRMPGFSASIGHCGYVSLSYSLLDTSHRSPLIPSG